MVLESNPSPVQSPPRSPLITFDRLSLTLGLRKNRAGKVLSPGTRLFEQMSWRLHAGDHAAIVGPSGSGKTSFLRLLNRLISPTTGTLFWQGNSYAQIPVEQLRQEIVYVAQVPKLLGMTVEQAIAYPLRLRQKSDGEIQSRLTEIYDRLEIPTAWLSQTELQLSQSSQQWVSLARAFTVAPPVLLLDEPTAHLDATQQHRLLQILGSLSHTTLVIATHDPTWSQDLTRNLFQLSARTGPGSDRSDDEDW